MPLEGHGMDCDCGCCDVETEPQGKAQGKFVCPVCGKKVSGEACTVCAAPKCPACGVDMQPGK
jgi:hypothetical protein